MNVRCRWLLAACLLTALIPACSGERAPSAAVALQRFTQAWATGDAAALRRTAAGPETEQAAVATSGMRDAGVVTAEVVRSQPLERNSIDGSIELRFGDGGRLGFTVRAQVQHGRIVAAPAAVVGSLSSWTPVRVDAAAAPPADLQRSDGERFGSLVDGKREAPERDAPAAALLDATGDPAVVGIPGRRLLGGSEVLAETPAQPAPPFRTTLDGKWQAMASQALDGRSGTVAVLDAATGHILAVAANSTPEIPGPQLPGTALPPGSIFKIVTAAAALQAGIVKPQTLVDCPGTLSLGGFTVRNPGGVPLGRVTLARALAVSCSTAFARLGLGVGFERLREMAELLGLSGLASATSGAQPGVLDVPRDDAALGRLAYGSSGSRMTGLAIAGALASIATGHRVTPTWDENAKAGRTGPGLDAAVARDLLEMLREVVRSGTASGAAIPGLDLAGKTGTTLDAATPNDGTRDGWFAVVALGTRRSVVVVCYVANAGPGGGTPAQIARDLLGTGRSELG